MAGIDRNTGKILDGWPHVVQSLGVLFTTHYGSRVMRRFFGSDIPKLLGNNITRATVVRFCAAVIIAVDLWEPRFKVRKIDIDPNSNTPENLRLGRLSLAVRGEYRPRGHLGDFTVEGGEYTLTIASGGDNGVIVT